MNIHGAKKGGGKQRQPVIAPDSAQSKTFISIMYGLGEGEIVGLANGYQSVYLEDTPLQNDNGEFNFAGVKVDFRTGTNDQEYIDGFPDVASETAVGVELKHGTPFVKAFNNLDLDALRVRLKWGVLRQQDRENGDVSGVKIDYAIDVKTDNGGWVQVLTTAINAKTSDAYERSHRIDLPKAQTGWQLRVRRITPNSTSEFISDKMYIAAISEVIDLKLRYPNTALLGLRYDATSFSNVAKMSARCKGLIIKVPTNYDPVARTYTGLWNGEFKMAYSNNPAWVYYDLCTAERYGLGGRLTQSMIDKWSLYRLAQYGGRNLLKNSQAERTVGNTTARENFVPAYTLTKPLEPNTAYVLSFEYKTTDNAKTAQVGFVSPVGQHKFKTDLTKTTDWQKGVFKFTTGNNANQAGYIRFDNEGTTDGQSASLWVRNAKLELGSIPTDYTPAPEDTQNQLDNKATTASLNEFKQTSANADKALGERITAIDTAYKQADTATNAKLANAQKAISDNNTALSQRITALDTAYKSADNHLTARLAREETARATGDNANAQAIRTLESTVNGIGGRVGTSESKIASLERTTANTNQALATAQSQLNARFDSLSIGGRNLLLATNKMTDTRLWQFGKHANQTQTELPRTDSTLTLKSNNHAWVQYYQRSDRNAVLAEELVGGQTYTLSFEARANTTATGYIRTFLRQHYQGGNNNTAKHFTVSQVDVWEKFSHTFICQERHTNHLYWQVIIEINNATAGQFEFRKVKLERGNIATDWTEAPEDLQVDLSPYATNASLNEFKQTQATKDTATAQKLSQLESTLGTKANTTALNSLTIKVGQVDGKITAEAQKVSTLQTTVQGQSASIQQHAQSLNGLSAQWTLKVQSGNIVSGIGLASNNGVSDFAVRADKFYIAPPTGTGKGSTPFAVLTSPQVINGVRVPAGTYIRSAFIQDGSIDIAKINKASIGSLSAISATIGTLRTKTSGARVEIKDNLIAVYDSNNKLRVRMGVW